MRVIEAGAIISILCLSMIGTVRAQTIIKGSLYLEQPNVSALYAAFKTMESLGYDVRSTTAVVATRLTPKYIPVSFLPATDSERPRVTPFDVTSQEFFQKVPKMTVFIEKDTLAVAGYQIDGYEFVRMK